MKQHEQDLVVEGDNAKEHISNRCRQWIQSHNINHVQFGCHPINEKGGRPPISPELCPIELVFADVAKIVEKYHPKTVEQLMETTERE